MHMWFITEILEGIKQPVNLILLKGNKNPLMLRPKYFGLCVFISLLRILRIFACYTTIMIKSEIWVISLWLRLGHQKWYVPYGLLRSYQVFSSLALDLVYTRICFNDECFELFVLSQWKEMEMNHIHIKVCTSRICFPSNSFIDSHFPYIGDTVAINKHWTLAACNKIMLSFSSQFSLTAVLWYLKKGLLIDGWCDADKSSYNVTWFVYNHLSLTGC